MNQKRFYRFMTSIDDTFLEEAMDVSDRYRKRFYRYAALAASICFVAGTCFWVIPWGRAEKQENYTDENSSNAIVTEAVLKELGYDIKIPDDASSVEYILISREDHDIPLLQTSFSMNGTNYVCCTQQTDYPELLHDFEYQENSISWTMGELELCSYQYDTFSYVDWYISDTGTQWSLCAQIDDTSVMTTARDILINLGLDVKVEPEGAQDVLYHVFSLEDFVVAETSFLWEGVQYSYRMASASEIFNELPDISETGENYAIEQNSEVGWCPAQLYYTEGEAGKVIWFDVVPGLLYSLTVNDGASERTLLDMAETLYTPAQNEEN